MDWFCFQGHVLQYGNAQKNLYIHDFLPFSHRDPLKPGWHIHSIEPLSLTLQDPPFRQWYVELLTHLSDNERLYLYNEVWYLNDFVVSYNIELYLWLFSFSYQSHTFHQYIWDDIRKLVDLYRLRSMFHHFDMHTNDRFQSTCLLVGNHNNV